MTSAETNPELLLSLSDIARLAGVRPSNVSNWRSRNEDFPRPAGRSPRGDVYARADIVGWLRKAGYLSSERDVTDALWVAANSVRNQPMTEFPPLAFQLASAVQNSDPDNRQMVIDQGVTPESKAALEALADAFETVGDGGGAVRAAENWLIEYAEQLGRMSGDFRGTSALTELMVRIAGATDGCVIDPAVGSGDLLVAMGSLGGHLRLLGAERSTSAAELARYRLAAQGANSEVVAANALLVDPFPGTEADRVVSLPPMGLRNLAGELSPEIAREIGKSANVDFGWLFYALSHLSPDGRAVVGLPTGTLFRGGGDGRSRNELLRRGCVEAVIELPSGLLNNTGIRTAVWVLTNPARQRLDRVTIIDATGDEFDWHRAPLESVEKVVAEIGIGRTASTEDIGNRWSAQVPVLDLLAPDCSLSPARWANTLKDDDIELLAVAAKEALEALRKSREGALHGVGDVPKAQVSLTQDPEPPTVTLGQLVKQDFLAIQPGGHFKRDELDAVGIGVLGPESLEDPKLTPIGHLPDDALRTGGVTSPGDVIFCVTNGMARVDVQGGHAMSSNLLALRILDVNATLRPEILAAFLNTERVRLFAGGTARRINVKEVPIPIPPLGVQESMVHALQSLEAEHQLARRWADAAESAKTALVEAAAVGVYP